MQHTASGTTMCRPSKVYHIIWSSDAREGHLLLVSGVLRNAKITDQNALILVEEQVSRLNYKHVKRKTRNDKSRSIYV